MQVYGFDDAVIHRVSHFSLFISLWAQKSRLWLVKFPSGDPDLQRVREVFGTYLWRVSGRCLRRYLPGRRIHGTEFSKMAFLPPPHSAVRSSPWTSVEKKKKKKNGVLCFSDGFGTNFCENSIRLIFHEAISWDFRRQNFYQNAIGISGNG